jgi:hypothetical protein
MGVFVMPMIRIFGMVLLVISWVMELIGYSYRKSDLQKQGCMVFIIGLLIFGGSYFLN